MTSGGGGLCSDHVNYLIFRYLQEAGHEDTATAFHRDWHRSSEYRDPENYPWAGAVRRNELVSIIQSGLHLDELEARVKKNARKFQFAYVTSREAGGGSAERQHGGGVFENGALVGSRPSSSAASKRKGRPTSVVRPVDDFPTPAPKRQRRSEGSEGAHLNGEAMDIDAASPSAEADDDGDAVSPAVASEPEMTDVPERYDSMDVAVQTEVKAAPKTSAMYWKIDEPDAVIFHAAFNPSSDPENVNAYLTVGESLCRFYQIPAAVDGVQQILSVDEPSIPTNCVVTASAWHPSGRAFVLAVDTVRELSDARQPSRSMILSHECDKGITISYQLPSLLVPHGIVLAVRYSPDASRLLILQTNIKRAVVLIYSIPDSDTANAYDTENATLSAWRIFEHQVLDAQWVDLDGFVVAGNNGVADACFLDPTGPRPSLEENVGVNEMTIIGLINPVIWLPETSPSRAYDRVRVSTSGAIAVVATAGAEKKLIAAQHRASTHTVEFGAETDVQGNITALAFQPEPDADSAQPRFLAAAFEGGGCVVYSYFHAPAQTKEAKEGGTAADADAQSQQLQPPELKELLTFYLADGPALALAWSADGSYLAVAGTALVQIWDIKALVRLHGMAGDEGGKEVVRRPLVTWRPQSGASFGAATTGRNGEGEAKVLSEPSLSWSADGESLGFAVEREVAVIRFRPSLQRRDDEAETNGAG